MGDKSKIEWTEASWNPLAAYDKATGKRGWFCVHVSAGCKNCYAEALNRRLGNGRDYKAQEARNVNMALAPPSTLYAPIRWRRPRKIFTNSMTDLFGTDFGVTTEALDAFYAIMALTPRHTYQNLTKRPEARRDYLSDPNTPMRVWREMDALCRQGVVSGVPGVRGLFPLKNVWEGVSCEDQETANARVPALLQTPAAVRWVSYEPALGPVDFTRIRLFPLTKPAGNIVYADALSGDGLTESGEILCAAPASLDWIVCGGESGPNARPMHPEWARKTRDQCQQAGVAFFFKQWGEYGPVGLDHRPCVTRIGDDDILGLAKIGKKAAGRILDKRTWDEYPGGGS